MVTMLRTFVLACLLLSVLGAAGCYKPLFPEGTSHTPYDRYRTLRGETVVTPERTTPGPSAAGPNLRERLRPLGSQ